MGQGMAAILKKAASDGDQQALEESLSAEFATCAPENLIDAFARHLIQFRAANRAKPQQAKASLSRLIEAMGAVARKRGISPSTFYPALTERVLIEEAPLLPARQDAKERILEAALEVFSQKGFHTATMDEIAEKAGVGKGTLYRHFETKKKLFAALVRIRLDELEKNSEEVNDADSDVLAMISNYIRIYFRFFDQNKRLYRLIMKEGLDLVEHSPDQYLKKVMRAIPNLKRKVYEGTQQGKLKDVDFQTVFYGTMGFAHGVIQKWLARDCTYPLCDEIPGVLEVLFHGFVRDNGATETVEPARHAPQGEFKEFFGSGQSDGKTIKKPRRTT